MSSEKYDAERAAFTAAQNRILGKRYCTTGQHMAHPEGGEQRPNRWICAACVARRDRRDGWNLYSRKPK